MEMLKFSPPAQTLWIICSTVTDVTFLYVGRVNRWKAILENNTGMATHSSVLAWRIPWTEGPGGLQSVGSQRVRHE